MPDFMRVQLGQVVSERFRHLIEDHDPGRHQFEPVSIVWSKPDIEQQTCYWIIPAVRLFAMDSERTQPPLGQNSGMFRAVGPMSDWKPVYRQAVVADHSVFVAAEMHAIHITSDFKSAMEAAGLNGYRTMGPFALAG